LLLVGHVLLVDALEGHQFSRELVHPHAHLPKGTSSEHFACAIEFRSGLGGLTLRLEALTDGVGDAHDLLGSGRELLVVLSQLEVAGCDHVGDLFWRNFAQLQCFLGNVD